MKKNIIISVTGKDRPGIVAIISKILFELGCNIEDSTMTILENEFAMILIVAVPSDNVKKKLTNALNKIKKETELAIFSKDLSKEETVRKRQEDSLPIRISVYGSDKPGIVYKVSRLLAGKRVNITDLHTQIIQSKKNPIYVMILEADVPKTIHFEDIKSQLEAAGKELSVDVTVNKIESAVL